MDLHCPEETVEARASMFAHISSIMTLREKLPWFRLMSTKVLQFFFKVFCPVKHRLLAANPLVCNIEKFTFGKFLKSY